MEREMETMDAYLAIVGKREVRDYLPDPIPEEEMSRILEAGRASGSSRNRQPWRFIVVSERTRLRELSGLMSRPANLTGCAAAIAVVLTNPRASFDAGRAAQNMMLAAWSMGVASCPCSMHHQECATRALGLPEGWRVCVVLALGYPDPAVAMSLGRQRLPMEEFVHEERW